MHTFNLAPVILAALASAAPNSNLYSQRNFGGATKAVQADGSCQEVTGNLFHHVLSIKISPGSGCHFYADDAWSDFLEEYTENQPDTGYAGREVGSVICDSQADDSE